MKPLVIYHSNCADGFGAAFAFWCSQCAHDTEFLPMGYHERDAFDVERVVGREVHILDFSFSLEKTEAILAKAKFVTWLDHHKTAFEAWCNTPPEKIEGQRWAHSTDRHHTVLDNNHSGAKLAAMHYLGRSEELFDHLDDYDRWQFKLPGTKEFNKGLWALQPWTFEKWVSMDMPEVKATGRALLQDHNGKVQQLLKDLRPFKIADVAGLGVNANSFFASDLGHELAKRSGTFGAVWSLRGDGRIAVSLRSNGDFDVSAIAKHFGGGGHKNAAGFEFSAQQLLEAIK